MPKPRLSMLAIAAATAVLAVAGCGDDDNDSGNGGGSGDNSSNAGGYGGGGSGSSTKEASGASTLKLAADPGGALKFDKSSLSTKAGTVTIDLDNPSSATAPHAVEVEGNGVEEESETIDPGQKTSVTVDLKAGEYEFYCPVDGHKAAGMEGTLTVN